MSSVNSKNVQKSHFSNRKFWVAKYEYAILEKKKTCVIYNTVFSEKWACGQDLKKNNFKLEKNFRVGFLRIRIFFTPTLKCFRKKKRAKTHCAFGYWVIGPIGSWAYYICSLFFSFF